MRRRFLIACAASLLPVVAAAQATATAEVQATVVSALALTRTGTTDFGTFDNHAHVESINPAGPAAGQSTAQFSAVGASGASILITFDASVTLCLAAGCAAGTMTFTPNVASSQADNQPGATPNLLTGSAVQLSTNGSHFFWLGGTLAVNTNQQTGAYSGVFSMSVSYQ